MAHPNWWLLLDPAAGEDSLIKLLGFMVQGMGSLAGLIFIIRQGLRLLNRRQDATTATAEKDAATAQAEKLRSDELRTIRERQERTITALEARLSTEQETTRAAMEQELAALRGQLDSNKATMLEQAGRISTMQGETQALSTNTMRVTNELIAQRGRLDELERWRGAVLLWLDTIDPTIRHGFPVVPPRASFPRSNDPTPTPPPFRALPPDKEPP